MPVFLATDDKQPKSPKGKPYRHILADCSLFKQSPSSARKAGVPNTIKLQERTERCPECWPKWEKEQSSKPTRTRTPKAASQPAKPAGNAKSGALAAKAAAARSRKKPDKATTTK